MAEFKAFEECTVNCLGDSTTWGDNGLETGGNQISWTTQIRDFIPFRAVRNYGQNGSRIAVTPDRDDGFVQRYERMADDADIVLVMGGVNDFQHDVPMGPADSADPRCFTGALRTLVPGLLRKYPDRRLVFLTPMKNDFVHPTKHYPNTFTRNGQGLVQADYAAVIRRVCDFYGVPVLDMFAASGISPFVEEQARRYMPDKLHYSRAGYRRLAARIAGFLRQMPPEA